MNRGLVLLCLCIATRGFSEEGEDDGNSQTGLRLSAGGPSKLGPGVRGSDLGITYEETDATLALGAGSFSVVRRYTSSDTWKAVSMGPQLFGPVSEANPSKIEWFSSLSSYAVLRYIDDPQLPSEGGRIRTFKVRVREVSGSLATAVGQDEVGTLAASDGARIQLGSGRALREEPEESLTLIRPGEGRWEYQRAGDCEEVSLVETKCSYKLKVIRRDDYAASPICMLNFIDDGTRVETVDCFGGVSLHIAWADESHVEALRILPTGADPASYEPTIQYEYADGRLSRVTRQDGTVSEYDYVDGSGFPGFSVRAGIPSTGLRTVFSKTREGPATWCDHPFGEPFDGNWYGAEATSIEVSPMGTWVYEGPQTLHPATCGGWLSSRSTRETTVGTVTETHRTIREGLALTNYAAGLTTLVERTCRVGVSLCPDVKDSNAEWSISVDYEVPYDRWARDFRGVYQVNLAILDNSVPNIPTPLLVQRREGASANTGDDATRVVRYNWSFFDAQATHEPLLSSRVMDSVLQLGGGSRVTYAYDSKTKLLKSTIVSGYTGNGTDTVEHRRIGTFVFPSRVCNGTSAADPMGRPLEIHGPCWVASESSTDCDIDLPGEMMPVTQFAYHPTTNGRRLASKTTFATTSLSMACSGGLTTTYDSYDTEGHVLHETDPSGIITERTYSGGRLISESRAGLTVEYLYHEAQGGRVSAMKDATGVWEVFCYRLGGTPEGQCTEGLPATELQWKARISGHPAATWTVLAKTTYSYTPHPGALPFGGGGLLTGERSERPSSPLRFVSRGFTYDALERLASVSAVDASGLPLFTSPRVVDAHGNVLGEGRPYNQAPSNCGGLDGTATTAQSSLCDRPVYDRLERVSTVVSAGGIEETGFEYDTSGNPVRITRNGEELVQYDYDDFGNIVTVRGSWADSNASRFVYDASGRVVARHSASLPVNESLTYAYDALGRPLGAFHSVNGSGDPLWLMGYDGETTEEQNCPVASSMGLKGRLQWKDDSFGRTWYEYDGRGLLVAERRTRAGAECSSDEASGSSDATPDTLYAYDSLGRLQETKYPHGLRVGQTWGSAGRQHEVVSMAIRRGSSSPWVPLVANVVYDVGGAIRSYSLGTTPAVVVEYFRTAPEQLPVSDCSFDPGSSDGSGRLAALRVSRSGSNVFLRKYGWKTDQISEQATCVLDDSEPVNESFLYDPMLQLNAAARPSGEQQSRGGPYEDVAYEYQGTDRVRQKSGENWWSYEYDKGRVRSQVPQSSSDSRDTSWYRRDFEYDPDGRVTQINETPVPRDIGSGVSVYTQREITLETDDGVGSVYRAVMVNGAVYQYLYDAQGRRRLKVYPSGLTDEFFYLGNRLIEDRGLSSPVSAEAYVLDQYVWLGSKQIAVVRESLTPEFEPREETECSRNDEASPCGTFYIINDYLPKPVAIIDSTGKLAGIGEYDPFGQVNTVSIRADAPALEYSYAFTRFGHYRPGENVAIVTFAQPPRTSSQRVRARVNYAQINTERSADRTWLADAATGQALSPPYSGVMKAYQTPWVPVQSALGVSVWWTSDATMPKRYGGATTATYEYQRYEAGAEPLWIPARFPGQYADAETGLFENWNRFYDPGTGRYTASDPVLPSPQYVRNPYAYVSNNPVVRMDRDGRQEGGAMNVRAQNISKQASSDADRCKHGDKDACNRGKAMLAAAAVLVVVNGAAVVAAASPSTVVVVGTTTTTTAATQGEKAGRALDAVVTSGSQVTEGVIRIAMQNASLQSQQAGGVSLPMVQNYVDKIIAGGLAPPIKVDGSIIIDGNHRYIAGQIMGQIPGVQQWSGGDAARVVAWDKIPIHPESW